MKKRRFADAGEVEDTIPPGGRFSEDVYARARKFLQDEERRAGEGMASEETPKAAPAVKRASKPSAPATPVRKEPEAPAGRIPRGEEVGPVGGESVPSERERNINMILGGIGAATGLGVLGTLGARAGRARQAIQSAREATKTAAMREMFKPKQTAEGTASELKEAFKSATKRGSEAKRVKETEAVDKFSDVSQYGYRKGGKATASSRADGIAKRGKTRGKMY